MNLILTLIGPDKPGLVDALAAAIAQRHGNWTESRMIHLEGQFAGLLRVDLPEEEVSDLEAALSELQTGGLHIHMVRASDGKQATRHTGSIHLLGQDRPGIIHEISRILALHQVNVEELESACSSAPMSGEILFEANLRVTFPSEAATADVRLALEKLAADMMVDITFKD